MTFGKPVILTNIIQERDDEIQDKRERANREIPFLIFTPLLRGSPNTTSNTISISMVSSLPTSTPNQQIEALWEKVTLLKDKLGNDLNSDDFNLDDDIPTLEARTTVSPAPDPTPNPAPAPIASKF